MNIIEGLILSFIEGITEFLPISSTAHLILASSLLNIQSDSFTKSFEVIIQLGAILAVLTLYWRKVLLTTKLWKTLIAAFLPTAVIGALLYKLVKNNLLENIPVTLFALGFGGVILFILEEYILPNRNHEKQIENMEQISIKQAVIVGCVQSLSIIPGVSRAAATIMGGLFMGFSKETALEFSFLLAIPTMAAAASLDLAKSGFAFTELQWIILALGFVGAFITAYFTVKFFLHYIKRSSFTPFALYRILLAVILWMFLV